MKINILSEETILKIAAGEVVERPASVVKELVDNAVDAGATTVSIEVFNGGLDSIIVSDDGEGMAAEDLALAVLRHSTSKIAGSSDLFNITTMGFRGEALTSIGAVSAMTITSGRRQDVAGSVLTVTGGQQGEVEPAANPGGTKIEVRALFFNTPARKKFLRKPAAEFTAIAEIVHQQVLARPGIRFKLLHNGKSVLSSPGTGSLTDAIAALAGTEIAENLLPCSGSSEGYTVSGYIVRPEFHRSNRAMQYFTVNGRPVSLRLAGSALERAYHTLLPVNRYPIAFLNLEVPSSQVDVNVHPAKREVKFSDASKIFTLVSWSCGEALKPVTAIPHRPPAEISYQRPESPETVSYPRSGYSPPLAYRIQPEGKQVVQEAFKTPLPAGGQVDYPGTVLGQVFSTFLVVATPSELRLVDQHAAQERVLYEKYLGLLKEGERPGQVIIPIETPLSGRSRQFVEAWLPRLTELGFKIQLTDTGMVLKEAPVLFKKVLSEADILEIIEYLQQHEGSEYSLGDYQQAALMLLACKGAVKANQRLSPGESLQLLMDLEACENSRTCPHGRPIWVAFNRENLEKLFARR
ncbi:MAG: DNA mismatch repair endonuclease MutL [Eubacteriales bacterium]|nr:DNA mismatch repair endonuclease MutL [Eubacteriales bacterium]